MRRASDLALKYKPPHKHISTFLITPIMSYFPLQDIYTKCTIGEDFSIWGYAL